MDTFMKVISSKQMPNLELQAYQHGASESDFMEEAGSGVALVVHDLIEKNNLSKKVILLCGRGNNGGDAYVAGSHLLHLDYDVIAFQLYPFGECSYLCRQSYFRFLNDGGHVKEIDSVQQLMLPKEGVIVDGIFGTGFRGNVEEPITSIIRQVNDSQLPIIAVDIPSGLNGETGIVSGEAIRASGTAFLGLPKTGFFLNDGWNYVGKLSYVDFGLSQEIIEEAVADFFMLSEEFVKPLLPSIKRNRHKYEAGYVVGLAGSADMPGAAILASLSAMCGGAGVVRLLYRDNMRHELLTTPYELLKTAYHQDNLENIVNMINQSTATFIGPGLGLANDVRQMLRYIIPKLDKPCVIDADALTILAEENIPFPPHSVLTPHRGEMRRLLKLSTRENFDLEFLKICQDYAKKHKVTLILKGSPTFIFHSNEPLFVNPQGDPGMATAGSGDVLAGLIAALLAQGLSTHHAAILGTYLHSLAGESAAEEMTSYGMIASDIISHFPEAFQFRLL